MGNACAGLLSQYLNDLVNFKYIYPDLPHSMKSMNFTQEKVTGLKKLAFI